MSFFLSIVIPFYNEENCISKSLERIVEYFSNKSYNYELILVDDGSIDSSLNKVRRFKENLGDEIRNCKFSILVNKENKGKGYSIRRGILTSVGKYVLFTDADLAVPIEEFEKLLNYIENDDFNIAIGSKYMYGFEIVSKKNILRRITGKIFNFLVRTIVRLDFKDTQCGFKIFDRKSVNFLFPYLKIDDFSFDIEILYLANKKGLRIREVPIRYSFSDASKVNIIKSSISMFFNLMKLKKIHKS